jgi:hypothetical protein
VAISASSVTRGDEVATDPVFDDFGCGAVGERDDGGAGAERLDHDHSERLGPSDRHQQPAGVSEQVEFDVAPDFTDVGDPLTVEVRGDRLPENVSCPA